MEYYRKNGIQKTSKKILIKIKNKIFSSKEQRKIEQEENENYKKWIEENEPNIQEIIAEGEH